MSNRRIASVAIPFAVLLTVCDSVFHVRTNTLEYHWDPQVLDQTILVPLTFWLAAVGMLLTVRVVHPAGPSATGAKVVDGLVLVTLAYLASGLIAPDHAGAYAVALLLGWVVRLVWRTDRRTAVVIGVAIASGGVLGEAGLSALGEFSYLHPDVLGVPWWLFPLYLHGSLVAIDLVALSRQGTGVTSRVTGRRQPEASRP